MLECLIFVDSSKGIKPSLRCACVAASASDADADYEPFELSIHCACHRFVLVPSRNLNERLEKLRYPFGDGLNGNQREPPPPICVVPVVCTEIADI